MRYSDAAAIFYDVSNMKSFKGVENWYNSIREFRNIPVILIACKCNYLEKREISKEEAEKYANEKRIYISYLFS